MKLKDMQDVISTDLMIYDSSERKLHKNVCVYDDVFNILKEKVVTKVTTGIHASEKNLDNNLINGLLICVKNA